MCSTLKFLENPFALTSTVKKSFEMVLMAVSQRWPVLLHGPGGAGKTALVNRLASISGNQGKLCNSSLSGAVVCSNVTWTDRAWVIKSKCPELSDREDLEVGLHMQI